MRIMSVDDSHSIRAIVRNTADVLGFECVEAEDGRQAMDMLHSLDAKVDLILLDWNMPVMDGMETLQALKKDAALRHIPVTMVTTETERTKVIAAIQAGAKNYVMKPFSQEQLIGKIMDSLGMAE
jgi:two-component system chemotaxis response regulator CheY